MEQAYTSDDVSWVAGPCGAVVTNNTLDRSDSNSDGRTSFRGGPTPLERDS
jgi:hypothetical protein